MKKIRILLVDDHRLVRAGIRALLEQIPDVHVVAEAGNGRQALNLIKTHAPDILLIDIAMPELNGLDATERALTRHPGIKVIILSMHANEEYVLQALRVGASGYLLKDSATRELELAIHSVFRGDSFLSSSVSRHIINHYLDRTMGHPGPWNQLTSRQREILQMIAEGKTTKEIAFFLNISSKTVESHRKQLMDRLDIHDVPGLVRYAMQRGIIQSY